MAKKPDRREVCEKLFAHRIKQRQGLQRNQWAVDNAVKGAIALCATGPSYFPAQN
jgi:hypothetical protein